MWIWAEGGSDLQQQWEHAQGGIWRQRWCLANLVVCNAYSILCVISWPDYFIPNFSISFIPPLFKPVPPKSQNPITSQQSFCLDNQSQFLLLATKNSNGLLSTSPLGYLYLLYVLIRLGAILFCNSRVLWHNPKFLKCSCYFFKMLVSLYYTSMGIEKHL